MTREGMKQIDIVLQLECKYQSWLLAVDNWVENQSEPMPSLPEMVESLLHHLRGLDARKASEYDWMMII